MAASSVSWWSVLGKRATAFAKTKTSVKVIGALSQPVFRDMEEVHTKRVEQQATGEKDTNNPLKQCWDMFLDNFAWGDILSIGGVVLWGATSKLPKDENGEKSFFGGLVGNIAKAIAVGGIGAHIAGKIFDVDRMFGLGDNYAQALLADAKAKGKGIFIEYGKNDLEKLKEKAEVLNQLLVYDKDIAELIFDRHVTDQIGGFFEGPFGTGKTAGVECILGNWVQRVEDEGDIAVVAKLDISNFNQYIKERKDASKDKNDGANAILGTDTGAIGGMAENEGLLVLESLVSRMHELNEEVEKFNEGKTDEDQRKKLAIFIDEFDKVFDPANLRGCDKSRLKALIVQFNELYVKGNVLMTSNTDLEDLVKTLEEHLGETDENNETSGAMHDRMSKTRVRVDLPKAPEQARIIANNLVERYPECIDLSSLDLDGMTQGISSAKGRKELAAAILLHVSSKDGSNSLNGRHLEKAVENLELKLSGKANEIRAEKGIFDEGGSSIYEDDAEWRKLGALKRAELAGVKIDREMILNIVQGQQKAKTKTTKVSEDNIMADRILSEYLGAEDKLLALKQKASSKREALGQSKAKIEMFELLEEVYTKRAKPGRTIYQSNESVEIDGRHYGHAILLDKGSDEKTPPTVKIRFYEEPEAGMVPSDIDDYDFSEPMLQKVFESQVTTKIAGAVKPKAGIFEIITALAELGNGGDPSSVIEDLFRAA